MNYTLYICRDCRIVMGEDETIQVIEDGNSEVMEEHHFFCAKCWSKSKWNRKVNE